MNLESPAMSMELSIVNVRIVMALSKSVEESLKEAEASLRNALAFAARQERPMVCSVIADLISRIESLQNTDAMLDKLESRKFGDSGFFGTTFGE
jgi:hypothetical protein